MSTFATRAQRMTGALLVCSGVFVLDACDLNKNLLTPQQPGVISPGVVTSATAADALWSGALTYWNKAMNGSPTNSGSNQEGLWNWEGLFTDEIRSVDTFSQRNDDDQRNEATNDALLTTIYNTTQQARGRARDAINALNAYDQSATGKQHVGEMYMMMGYLEMQLSSVFCNGIPFSETVNAVPQYAQPVMDSVGTKLAISRLDTAITYLIAADTTVSATKNVKYATLITRARAQVDLGDFAGAAATVSGIPTTFQYNFNYSQPTFDNEWWVEGPNVKRYSAGDSVDIAGPILNAIPFAELNDPRVSVSNKGLNSEDGHSVLWQVNNWGRDDPIPVMSGIDARLIEAEARLQAGDIAGMMTILNALRASPQVIGIYQVPAMTPLAPPADQTSATNLFFREKALWEFGRGYRMDDLRRLVRQYGRSQDQVFPSGNFTRNGTPSGKFGTQVAFPVPDYEMTNPNFHGCLNTNA